MVPPIGLQLYTLREAAQSGYEAVVRRVAEIGYAGVEPAGFPGSSAQAAAKLYKELGLQVPSIHARFPEGANKNEAIETALTLGSKRIISGIGRGDKWDTLDKIKANCNLINESAANAAEHGLTVGYHNHWWEFDTIVDGRPAYEHMLELLDPNVFFQVDTYWVQVGGHNVVDVIKQLGSRAPILHIKDGPADKPESDMVAVGSGVMDWSAIMAASAATAEWHIVELDRCATDMYTAVADSYKFLVGKGLSRGKN
ncbi:MAG: sugar phosphate isomerase/epimerase [Anaerolineae bacterium]|nr:sugar phosphate isomerase/epimerase [Anaerolineae bacterium]